MSENPTLGSVHLPSFVSNYPTWHAYLDALRQDGTWGDHLTLMAAANVYHMSMTIVSSVEPVVIDPATNTSQGTILLGHIAELHYMTNQSSYFCRKDRSCCNCAPPTDKHEASTLELLCEHLLIVIYIFAFATMYCDQTTSNISAVCRRFNSLVKTQQFQDKQSQEHCLSTVADWSTKSKAYIEECLYSRKSAVVYMLCPKCGDEIHSHSGWQRGPNGLATLYASDGVCNACAYP